MKSLLPLVALAALTFAAPAVSRAQDSDDAEVTKMAKEHYKLGLDAYKNGKYDVAIKELKKAYLLKRLPALLLNIGATYRKMADFDLALHFYKKYLDEAPSDAPDRAEVESTIADIKVEKEGGGEKPETPKEVEVAPPRREEPAPRRSDMPREFSHSVIDAAPPDSPMDVRVSMPVMKGVKVYVYYRVAGQEDYKPVLMKRHGPEKVGRVPADAMQGKAIQYYIEARDPAGTVVNSSGSQVSPNIVMIDPSAKPQVVASLDRDRDRDRDEPEAREPADDETPRRSRRNLDDESAPVSGDISDDDRPRRRAERPKKAGKFGGMFWGGVGMLAGGVAIAAGGGGAMFALAGQRSSEISQNSAGSTSDGTKIFFNMDPNVTTQDSSLESQGKLFDTLGTTFTVVGSLVAVTGAVLMGVDQGLKARANERPRRRRRRRVVVDEEASLGPWYIAPALGPKYAGVGAGFSF